jgi:hypothetical protein
MTDKMTRLEKVALTSAVSGAVFNVFLYGIGANLASAGEGTPLYTVRIVAAILQAAAFDLVAIATVMGRQHGRWNTWSKVTAVASALVSALIALDVAGVFSQPWLHAANALIVLAFTLHLLTPGRSSRPRQLRRLVRQLVSRLRQERHVAEYNLSILRAASERLEQDRAALEQMLATARAELNRKPPPLELEVIRVARYELTWEQAEQFARMVLDKRAASLSSVRRYVAQLAQEETIV